MTKDEKNAQQNYTNYKKTMKEQKKTRENNV